MARRDAVIARLTQTVDILGNLSDSFVFLGGSVAPLLVTDTAAADARNTIDVDAIVQASTRSEYQAIAAQLALVHFHLDLQEEVMCRYKNGQLILDVMPTNPEVLTFGNDWYPQVFRDPISYTLPNLKVISIINAPLYLCTKYDAYKARGQADEKDLQDIVAIVDGRSELVVELQSASREVKEHVAKCTKELFDSDFPERINWFLPQDLASAAREDLVRERFQNLKNLA